MLELLGCDPHSVIAIVSGRSLADLERWFGRINNIWLAAEHGATIRSPDGEHRELGNTVALDEYKNRVFPLLEHFVVRTPGSFVEEKEFSLVWHYRMSDPEFGEWLANDLVANLNHMLADSPVRAIKGEKTVEVKMSWANKGQVYSRLLLAHPHPDFILAAGDDVTDEDLFAAVPDRAWTIHVGGGQSKARYYVDGAEDMSQLLVGVCEAITLESSKNSKEIEWPVVDLDCVLATKMTL